jgi:AbrB family looped-hinge helix DNA binding protein
MAANTVSVTIDKAGRLVLPKAMRDALHLKPGSSLEVERRDDELILRTPQPDAEIVYKNGIPVLRTRGGGAITQEMVNEALREGYEERERRILGE